MQSKVHPTYKTKYRVANWPAYNQALVRRGDVTVWLSSEAIAAWTPRRSGRRGGQRRYSDLAIETALTLRLLYHLPLRQAEGFLHALFEMMRLDLSAPWIQPENWEFETHRSRSVSSSTPAVSCGVLLWSVHPISGRVCYALDSRSRSVRLCGVQLTCLHIEAVLGCAILHRTTVLDRPASSRIGR